MPEGDDDVASFALEKIELYVAVSIVYLSSGIW